MIEKTELCEIAFKYGTDKCPEIKHSYTPVYHEMFKDIRNDVKKVFEMGIGSPTTMKHVEEKTGAKYTIGASLLMWRDYFPNAQIYGADNDPDAMVEGEERIKTFLCDEHKEEDVKRVIKETGSDIDIFIDDANHLHGHQLFLSNTALPLLKKDVIYIVEDVFYPKRITRLSDYQCEVPELQIKDKLREHIVIIKNK